MNRARYCILLARALHVGSVSPQLHALLTFIAQEQIAGRVVTIQGAADELACGYNAIIYHTRQDGKNHSLFHVDREKSPAVLGISQSGVDLLREVDERIRLYETQPDDICVSRNG